MGPIKEQRSGLGGGRVLIIGEIVGGKLSSFVLNSSVLHSRAGFLWFSWKPCSVQGQHKVNFSSGFFSQMYSKVEIMSLLMIRKALLLATYTHGEMYFFAPLYSKKFTVHNIVVLIVYNIYIRFLIYSEF